MTLTELVEAFCEVLRQRQLSVRTVTEQRSTLMKFVEQLALNAPATALTNEHLAAYRSWLGQFAATTCAERSRVVRRFLRWVHEQGDLARPLDAGWKIDKARPQAWIPSSGQVSGLLEAPGGSLMGRRDQVVLELLYGTGLRRSECSALDLRDWDRELPGLWVRLGKGRKDRLQPVGKVLASQINRYVSEIRPLLGPSPEETALLLTCTGKRLQHYSVAEIVNRYRRQLELPKLTVHTLRRAYANHMLQNGAEIHHLQQLLNHQSPETTMLYTQITLEELRDEHRRTHPRARTRGRRL